MFSRKNILAALEMYYIRLGVLNRKISETVAKDSIGGPEELQDMLVMSIIQNEVDDIYRCLQVLDELLHRE